MASGIRKEEQQGKNRACGVRAAALQSDPFSCCYPVHASISPGFSTYIHGEKD